ncbi:NAD(P)H-hydrate dehydratase [Clostridium felsineum]|uniref:NAD(P)H-hydrate dehydratase n=1 Tax=Clostridium felsineum TaxID=36839 RepID=UPI00098C658C|nr:NAD(P)H-hydrate dehydratase [Clostridium felsineum]URZ17959.1 Bifunctional NAD(P)H-hydrate repair enzyme Nnr [Clostridium felsineum DSM 794]
MRIGNSKVMNYIDQFCTINLGIPGTILMENAALKVVKNVEEKYKNIVIVCGVGNNGGDGMACARHFKAMEKNIEVFCIGNMEKMSKDCKFNYDILINMGIKVQNITDDEYITKFEEKIKNADLILDCIFGTGLNREVKGIYSVVISIINENANYIMSVDVPTGLNSDNGFVMGNAIKANKTISFVMQKKGFFNYKNEVYTGEVIIENIGVPEFVIEKFHEYMYIVDENMITNSILKRDKYAHKGDFGKVCIFAGSKGYSGAAYIATEAAVRCGSGLTTLCTANELQEVLSSKLVEAMTVNFEEKERVQKLISSCNAIGVGPGMGNSKETFEIVKEIISKASCPVVLDADAINVLKDKIGILKLKKNKIILTPHPGEMSRISGISVEKIEENRIDVAKKFAFDHNIILVLKGYNTIITDGKSVFINSTGSSYMASGGMGDCLTGIIVSLVGQGYAPIIAAVIGSFIHGYCGDNLSHKMENVTASDVLHEIPYAIKKLVIKKTNYEY